MDRPEVQQIAGDIGEQGTVEKTGYKVMNGAATILVVNGLMI